MFSLVLKAFFLNPVLPILLVAAAVLGIILAYAGGRKMMSTVFVVEAVALIVYTCIFLFGIAPALGIGAAICRNDGVHASLARQPHSAARGDDRRRGSLCRAPAASRLGSC